MSNQYRSILKATSIFGGTQLIQVFVSLIRAKMVALMIGTAGMGLNSLYMSTLTVFTAIFGLGVNMSVVKDLSKAFNQNDWHHYSIITVTFRRLLLLLGTIGMIVVVTLSPWLSSWSFGNSDHAWDFVFLSVVVLFTLLSQGNTSVLVSSRRIKSTALSTLVSSIVSLLIAVPFFYFLRLDGVVPGIVFSTIANYIVTYLFAREVKIDRVILPFAKWKSISKELISLGVAMVIASLVGQLTTYLVNLFVTRLGGLVDLGLYSAGFSITFQTLTMVFASMGSDYFPRLSAVMDDKQKMNETMNQQSEIVLLIAVPILAVFMLVAPFVIRILLSEDFLPVTGFIRVLCLGMLLRAASYALGYASFAKGDKKVYLLLEGGYSNVSNLILSVVMYIFWGLNGLAWSFVINYFLYYFVIRIVDSRRYGFQSSRSVNYIIVMSVTAMMGLLILSMVLTSILYYIVGSVLTIVLSYYCLKSLNEITGLINSILCRIKK